MAIALVGGVIAQAVSGQQLVWHQSTTAGNMGILWVACTGANGGATPPVPSGWLSAVAFNGQAFIFYKPNLAAGEGNFAISGSGFIEIEAGLAEFSGAATSSPLEVTGTATGATSPQVATASAADAAAGNLVVVCAADILSKAGTTSFTDTYNNGGSASAASINNGATSTANHYDFSFAVTTGNSVADNVSHADSSMNLTSIAVALATFKPAPPPPPPILPVLSPNFMSVAASRASNY